MRHAIPMLLLVAAAATTACASSGTGQNRGERNLITTEQLAQVPAENAYEAVRNLRPRWLESRGPNSLSGQSGETAVVYRDGVRVGELEYMRNISITTLAEIRYWDAGQASARFGIGLPRGVIELISKGSR